MSFQSGKSLVASRRNLANWRDGGILLRVAAALYLSKQIHDTFIGGKYGGR